MIVTQVFGKAARKEKTLVLTPFRCDCGRMVTESAVSMGREDGSVQVVCEECGDMAGGPR